MKVIMFGRQEAEALVDLLEEQPERMLFDHSCKEMAADIRKAFGMATFEREQEFIKNETTYMERS